MTRHRPRIVHVGLPKTGTTWLQASLRRHRLTPDRDAMFLGALDVREQYDGWGRSPAETRGAWLRLVEEPHPVLSHELLAAASPERTAWVRHGLDQPHLVVTARDPARQAVAEWQEGVKHGRRLSFARFAAKVLPDDADGPHAVKFRAAQDLPAVLERWAADLPKERVHVVTCPPPDADPTLLWRRFAEACGVDPDLEPAGQDARNPSLGVDEVRLLRRVNKMLAGRLQEPAYGRLVKQRFAQELLAGRSPAPQLPTELCADLTLRAERWAKEIQAAGWTVHGDLADLVPRPPADDVRHPDDADAEQQARTGAAVAAELLVDLAARDEEIATLRAEVARLARKRDKLKRRLTHRS